MPFLSKLISNLTTPRSNSPPPPPARPVTMNTPLPSRRSKCPGKINPIARVDARFYPELESKCTSCCMWFDTRTGSVCSVRACKQLYCARCGATEKILDEHELLVSQARGRMVG